MGRGALDRHLLAGDALDAARALLGTRLVREDATGRRVARIVEVEAYVGEDDRASHARFGRTDRNTVMWGLAGRAYVYLVYGMYDCLNVVSGPEGFPAAVLVRAAQPIEGIETMRAARLAHVAARRRTDAAGLSAEAERLRALPAGRLADGPGLLAAAFGLDRAWTGADLCDEASALRIEPRPRREPAPAILATSRVGIAYAGEPWVGRPWRFLALPVEPPGVPPGPTADTGPDPRTTRRRA